MKTLVLIPVFFLGGIVAAAIVAMVAVLFALGILVLGASLTLVLLLVAALSPLNAVVMMHHVRKDAKKKAEPTSDHPYKY